MDSNWPRKGNRNCQVPRSMKNVHSNRVTVHSEETPFLPAFNKRNCSRVRLSFEIQSFSSLLHSAIVEWSKFLSFAFTECHPIGTQVDGQPLPQLLPNGTPIGELITSRFRMRLSLTWCPFTRLDSWTDHCHSHRTVTSSGRAANCPSQVQWELVQKLPATSWSKNCLSPPSKLIMSLLMTGGPLVLVSNRS